MGTQSAPDAEIAGIAGRQGGCIAHEQLRAIGFSPAAIQRRVRAGRLHPRHRGVYAVGRAGRERHAGIKVHRPRELPSDILRGLPITTPARTLLDLSAAGIRNLDTILDRAEQQRLISFDELHALLERYPRRPGTRSLKAQLDRYRGPVDVRSELERLVHKLCDARGLPLPNVNCVIEGKVRDFYWSHCRLVVEADSYTWHRSPGALNADRERDVELTLAGYRVLRFTYEQVTQRPEYVISAILSALGAD
jgi:hypothetical protein